MSDEEAVKVDFAHMSMVGTMYLPGYQDKIHPGKTIGLYDDRGYSALARVLATDNKGVLVSVKMSTYRKGPQK